MTKRGGVAGFQPGRLTFARKRRRLSQAELSRALSVSPRTVQRYESGAEPPKEENLAKLSSVLGFPRAFFLDARPLAEIPAGRLSFRAYSKLKAHSRDNAIAVAAFAVEIARWLSAEWDLPSCRIPDLHEAAGPDAAARLLRDEWAVGSGPILSMVGLLEARGARVFSLADNAVDVDAFCFRYDGIPFVVLNQKKSAERGRFDAAHELGHLVLHQHIDFAGKDVEREADSFAAEFLVPTDSLLGQLPNVISLHTVMKLKQFWRVSAMAMVKRLKDVGRLSDWTYRTMCIQLGQQGFRGAEPGGLPREVSSVYPEIFRAMEAECGGISEMASALNVRSSEISPLIFGLSARGLRVIEGGVQGNNVELDT